MGVSRRLSFTQFQIHLSPRRLFFIDILLPFGSIRCEKKYATLNLIWTLARTLFPIDIILPDLRTWASFPVTSVSRVASTAVWANGIGALRVHVTGGR